MELLNKIGLLFVVFHTVASDISYPVTKEGAIKGTFGCASRCFSTSFPDAAYFAYSGALDRCTCRSRSDKLIFEEDTRLNYNVNEAIKICTEWCYQGVDPADVGYVSYDRQYEKCFCRDVRDNATVNIYLNDLENMKKCYVQCSEGNTKPNVFHYDTEKGACDCTKQ